MIIRRPIATGAVQRTGSRAFCELDQWSFDPCYTDGKCPICGWVPAGAPAAPAWLMLARKLEWEIAGLVLLAVVLVVLGVVVAKAAGYQLPIFATHAPASAPNVASPARTTSSPPSSASPSPSHHPTPSPSH